MDCSFGGNENMEKIFKTFSRADSSNGMEAINRDIKLYEEENGLVEIDRSAPAVSITMCVGERGYISRIFAIAVTSTFVKKNEICE
jgi:hypothetical protein